MATLTRVTGKIFGGDAPLEQVGVFGSAKAGTPTNSIDVATIQGQDAYLQGWESGVVTSRNFPPIEEVTGVLKTISYQNCYLLQEGCPIYDINTEYSATSIVKNISGNVLQFYISKQNGNIGNPLTDTNYWQLAIFQGTSAIGVPQFTLNMNAVIPENCIWLEGAAVSRTDYNNLFAIYGTSYGSGDGSTTFNLPDFRNRYICGVDNSLTAGYVAAGLPNLGLSTQSAGTHTHTRGTMEIKGTVSNLGMQSTGQPTFSYSGALYNANIGGASQAPSSITQVGSNIDNIGFQASRNWTGSTSSNGAHTHTITSSNSLVGSTSTVKVDGIKVRVYTRYI